MVNEILEIFTTHGTDLPSVSQVIFILITLSAYGLIVSLTYLMSEKERSPSRGYALTLVIIPPTVTIIIIMVGANLASALTLGGALAIIRFRSVPSDPKDIAYVLFCTAIGLTGGRGLLLYALCITLVLCLVMILLTRLRYASPRNMEKTLKITMPENFNYKHAFDDVFKKYLLNASQKRIRTTDLGSLFEVTYKVNMPDSVDEKAFIDELRTLNGNLPIILTVADTPNIPYWI